MIVRLIILFAQVNTKLQLCMPIGKTKSCRHDPDMLSSQGYEIIPTLKWNKYLILINSVIINIIGRMEQFRTKSSSNLKQLMFCFKG